MNPETKIENAFVDEVWKYLGIKAGKLKIEGETGYPDRILWLPGGKPLLIEFKVPGADPKPHQEGKHELLKKLGYNVKVFDNVPDAFKCTLEALDPRALSEKGRKILAGAWGRWAVLKARST